MTKKNKHLLKLLSLSLLPIAAISIPAVLLTSCGNKKSDSDSEDNSSNNNPENPDNENNGDSNNNPDLNLDKIKEDISSNFNNIVNSENFNNLFLDYETCINTLCDFSNDLSSSDISNLSIKDISTSGDTNLKLSIEFYINESAVYINIDSNVINPNSDKNLSFFEIDNEGTLTGLTIDGLNEKILYIPSNVKNINFPNNYGNTTIINTEIINFSFARNFVGFVNNDTFINNNSIRSIIFDGCSNFTDWKQGTFSRMQMLENISFEACSSLVEIPKWGIDLCENLKSINLKKCYKLNKISANAFQNCSNLTSIDLSSADTAFTIGNSAFSGCNSLEFIDLSNIISFTCGIGNFNLKSLQKVITSSKLVHDSVAKYIDKTNTELILNAQKLGNSIDYDIKNKKYEKSGFLKNAIERANDDSILYYSCNNNGVMHTYGTIAHILKVLEINPNKEMHLIMSDRVYNSDWRSCNLDFFEDKEKFPNVHLYRTTLNEDSTGSLSAQYQYSISGIPDMDNGGIIDIIKKYNHENDKNVIYTADVTFNWFMCLWSNISPTLSQFTKNNCLTNYFNLFKMVDEVNLINDGTMSTNIFSNLTYNLYKTNDPIFYYDIENDTFPNMVELQKQVNQMSSEEFANWLNESATNFYYYMYSLISAGKSNEPGVTKTKYYVASTSMVKDVNNKSSTQFNDNVATDEYFNPYNAQGFNFIDFFSSFKKETFENFIYVSGIKDVNNVLRISDAVNTFEGKNNIIWIGDRIAKSSSAVNSNAQKLVDILKHHININPDSYVYFKGHPREYKPTLNSLGEYEYWYVNQLKSRISYLINNDQSIPSELKEDYINRIMILDNQIPMEFFNASEIIKNNSKLYSKETNFIEYCTYSTYILSAEEYDFSLVDKIIISNSQNNDIVKRFGNGDDSLCFPNDKKYII